MCPFCDSQDKPVKENDLAQVILSNPHKVPGHVLVMPKRHIEQPWELTPFELQAIFELIFLIEKRFIGKLGEGVDIRQSYWPFKEQDNLKAKHVLFHVIPRSKDDYLFQISEGKNPEDLYAELDEVEGDAVARLLR
jgi:diadenosine tetraphosphate (Ap4A) HIT family hydrolase